MGEERLLPSRGTGRDAQDEVWRSGTPELRKIPASATFLKFEHTV